ncbi:hypothetical protein MASR2M41_09350 [Flammeovirgaceae bacterium]
MRGFDQHNSGKDFATRRFLPWRLVWYRLKKDRSEAVALEMKLKNLSVNRTIEFTVKHLVTENIRGLIIYPIENTGKK